MCNVDLVSLGFRSSVILLFIVNSQYDNCLLLTNYFDFSNEFIDPFRLQKRKLYLKHF